MELTITTIEQVTDRISLFTLNATDGSVLPAYAPGAHLEFDLPQIGSRAYSLVDFTAPQTPGAYRIAVQREDDGLGGSRAMHGLSPGDRLTASAPKNDFTLHDGPAPALLIAGGIGVTPIISFAAELAQRGADYAFHYATRDAAACAFAETLQGAHGAALSLWHDDQNPLDLEALITSAPRESHIYCCGPRGMIDAVRACAEAAGFPAGQVHFELFTAAAPEDGDAPFEVEISSTGQSFTIPPGKTIIDVLEAEGVDLMYDCQRGDCGICQVDVLDGTPDHRDVVLSDEERASGKIIQICVSRAKSPRLVLDI